MAKSDVPALGGNQTQIPYMGNRNSPTELPIFFASQIQPLTCRAKCLLQFAKDTARFFSLQALLSQNSFQVLLLLLRVSVAFPIC